MTSVKKIETETVTYFIENEILHAISKNEVDIGLEEAVKNLRQRREFLKGKKILMLSDISGLWQYSEEARAYFDKNGKVDLIALAVVVGTSMPIKIMAKFFIKQGKSNVPTKLFESKKDALLWLENFK